MHNPEYKYAIKIDKIIEHLREVLQSKGNYENFGQLELRRFNEKINKDYSLNYAERASLSSLLSERIREIQ